MPNLTGILGTMMATGMAGRSRRGRGMAASGGGGFGQKAGLAALGYLAYKAYRDYQSNQASRDRLPGRDIPQSQMDPGGGGLGDRLSHGLMGRRGDVHDEPEAQFSDQKALLLIRAMIAAAAADGTISADERQRILGQLEEAGASDEDRRFVEGELERPKPLDSLIGDVRDPETAEQVLLASTMAIEADTPAERSYLDYLAARLNVDEERVRTIIGRA